jgi:glycosyltransferase involved in cell wall biosynthesis
VNVEKPRKLLIVTPRYLPLLGGMERECDLLAKAYASRGYQVTVITEQLDESPMDERLGHIRILRFRSSELRSVRVQLRAAWNYARLIRGNARGADFVMVRTFTLPAIVTGFMKRLGLLRVPTVVTAETGGQADDIRALLRYRAKALFMYALFAHDRFNALCSSNVASYRDLSFPLDRVVNIPNGIDVDSWRVGKASKGVDRFVFVGRLDREKGLVELIEAFAELSVEVPGISLSIIGDGPDRSLVECAVKRFRVQRDVRMLGRVRYEDLPELLAQFDCLVLPSYSEGLPLSVFEAAASGRHLVLSDVSDLREYFGAQIQYCKPRDVATLIAALRAVRNCSSPDYSEVLARVDINNVARAFAVEMESVPT